MTFSLQLARHRRRAAPRRRPTRGFTIIELLTVTVLVGTLGRVAVPNVHELVLSARGQEVARSIGIIHLAAVDYLRDVGDWPADAYTGQVPEGLEDYLPEGFDFRGEGYVLDWEAWDVPDGLPDDPDATEVLAVSVVTGERALGQAVVDLLGGPLAHYVLDDRYTFVVTSR